MNQPKFRAWLINEKRMITHTQDFIPMRVTNFGLERLNPTMENNHWYLVDEPIELMQYIGKHDDNKTDIYQGDVVNVSWKSDGGDYIIEDDIIVVNDLSCQELNNQASGEPGLNWSIKSIEVIGNIHQHPELLENIR